MTPDEIKAMSDEQIDKAISGWKDGYDRYSTDLNAAWPLQFQDWLNYNKFIHALRDVSEDGGPISVIGEYSNPRRCARLICEAWLYLKTKGEQ